ncbi:hypothetical protein F0562_027444 [Nyssa sinensis]|uniref:MI domain-containing protein n=1 Tax=Nyssa sinensis TaxID=561372 RepID=A0A5J5B6Q3_9ASTE|nr:hypothetical protein F0562_027444 [Nyssa sinensis]
MSLRRTVVLLHAYPFAILVVLKQSGLKQPVVGSGVHNPRMMDITNGYMSNEHRELLRSASESADPLSVSPLQISLSRKSPRSPKSPKSPNSPRSPKGHQGKHGTSKGSPLKNDRNSHSKRDSHPKKGGSGGKGTWGGLLDTDDSYAVDPNDPNYTSNEENEQESEKKLSAPFEDYKRKAIIVVEEYFATDDVVSTANELRELGMPSYNYYFVKKLVSMAMDRHDREREMAAILLSSLYADVIDPRQVYKGFGKLVESANDLIVDIPDTIDVLALFIA